MNPNKNSPFDALGLMFPHDDDSKNQYLKWQKTFDQHYGKGFCSCDNRVTELLDDGTSVCRECTFEIKK